MYILLCTFMIIYLVGFVGEVLFWNRKLFFLFNFFVAMFMYQTLKEEKEKII